MGIFERLYRRSRNKSTSLFRPEMRIYLFLGVCIWVRFAAAVVLSFVAFKHINTPASKGAAKAVMALASIFFFAQHVYFDSHPNNRVWWSRPFHAFSWLMAFASSFFAWEATLAILVADVVIGIAKARVMRRYFSSSTETLASELMISYS